MTQSRSLKQLSIEHIIEFSLNILNTCSQMDLRLPQAAHGDVTRPRFV